LLADHQRLDQIVGIAEHYRRLLDDARGRVRATIYSAVSLTDEQELRMVSAFERVTARTVLATRQVDAGLLGGVVVEIAGKVYDGVSRPSCSTWL